MSPIHADGVVDVEQRRRTELAAFLRSRRARLQPDDLGLPSRHRRRTPGLRREDVAERAGVSLAWYTNLEQRRPINPSRAVVAAIATALCLDASDRGYLFTLTRHPAPTPAGPNLTLDVPTLQRFVDHVGAPAYCTDAATQVVAWNTDAAELFGDYGAWPAAERNLLWLLFHDTGFASRLVDRDEYAARVVGTFRDRSDAHRTDRRTIDLVESLRSTSADFRRLWDASTLRRATTDTLTTHGPEGLLTFALVTLQDIAGTGLRLSTYLPVDTSQRPVIA